MFSNRDLATVLRKLDDLQGKVDRLTRIIEASPGVRSLPVSENVALVRLANGQRLYVDSRDISIASHIMARGVWEGKYTAILPKLIAPGSVGIDIGANFGYYSVVMGGIIGPTGSCHAFEPNPYLFSLLQRSLKANGLLTITSAYNVALGKSFGTAHLHFMDGDFGGGSLFASAARIAAAKLDSVTVEVRTLDSFEIDSSRQIFAKIDAEGSEYNILQGGTNLLTRAAHLTVMMEFTPVFIARHLPVSDYIDFLLSLGVSLHVLEQGELVAISKQSLLERGSCYIFALKRPV